MVFVPWNFNEPLLATTGSDPSYRLVDLGTRGHTHGLMTQDVWAVSTGPNGTTTCIYVYRKSTGPMREVFHQNTSYGHPPWGDPVWDEKSITFRDSGRYLKDIMINAHVQRWHGHPDWGRENRASTPGYYQDMDADRTSVFKWDGDRYVGEMNVGK